MLNNDTPRPRMQLTKPVQTGNAGLVTPSNTTPPELGSARPGAPAVPGASPMPSAPQPPVSYLDIARNAIAQLTDDEVQMLLEEFLNKQSAPSAADLLMKGGAPNGI